jgi:hypothetical protein
VDVFVALVVELEVLEDFFVELVVENVVVELVV